eukprot:6976222-Pyramimonas_sp.AAC.1
MGILQESCRASTNPIDIRWAFHGSSTHLPEFWRHPVGIRQGAKEPYDNAIGLQRILLESYRNPIWLQRIL